MPRAWPTKLTKIEEEVQLRSTSSVITAAWPALCYSSLTEILPSVNKVYSTSLMGSIWRSGQLGHSSCGNARQPSSGCLRSMGNKVAGFKVFTGLKVSQGSQKAVPGTEWCGYLKSIDYWEVQEWHVAPKQLSFCCRVNVSTVRRVGAANADGQGGHPWEVQSKVLDK